MKHTRTVGALVVTVALSGCAISLTPGDGPADAAGPSDVHAVDIVDVAHAVDAMENCSCLPAGATVAWGYTGGRTAYDQSYRVESCRTISVFRTTHDGTTSASCSAMLPPCGVDALGIAEVLAVRNDPDVLAALRNSAPLIYGTDPRPWDGQIFELTIDATSIAIGVDCTTADAGCVPIPAGLAMARTTLDALAHQEQSALACVEP